MNAKLTLLDDSLKLINPHFTRISDLFGAPRFEATIKNSENNGIKQTLILRIKWAVYKYAASVLKALAAHSLIGGSDLCRFSLRNDPTHCLLNGNTFKSSRLSRFFNYSPIHAA